MVRREWRGGTEPPRFLLESPRIPERRGAILGARVNPDREVPEGLRPAVANAVDDLPAETVRLLAADIPGGFTKIDAIRTAWKRTMKGFQRMPDWLAQELRGCLGPSSALGLLDAGRIPEVLPLLREVTGADRVSVALWLDSRAEVQALAQAAPGEPPASAEPGSRRRWVDFVECHLLRPLGCSWKDSSAWLAAEAARPTPAEPASPKPELDRLRKQLEEARLRFAREKAELESRAVAERTAAADLARKLETERDVLHREIQRLQADFHQAVRREAREALDARIGHWLHQAETEAADLADATPAFEDLVRHVDQTLQRQAEVDRRQGNRAQLRRQLEQLRQRLDALDAATVEALDPLPALVRTRERLAEAIRVRETRLGETHRLLGVARELAVAIHHAGTDQRLAQLGKLATDLTAAQALPAEAAAELNALADQRRAILAAPELVRGHSGKRVPTTAAELLGGKGVAVVLIDAYNVIGEAGDALGLSSAASRLPSSLDGLLSRLRQFASTRTGLEFLVLVDSPRADTRSLAPNLRVHYSGGQGPDRADAILEGQLRHLRTRGERRPVLVVSNDAEVRRSAEQLGALPVHPRELALRLTTR
jgi:predicted RNA-binding protein with PIN domain